MIRWITYAACALVFVLLLAPARRSAESGSNKSYLPNDLLTRPFPFMTEGQQANDIHIKWRQKVHVVTATEDSPTGSEWKMDHGDNTDEMDLSVKNKGKDNLTAGGNLVLVFEPLGDPPNKTDFWDLVESYQWSLDGRKTYEEERKTKKFKVWTKSPPPPGEEKKSSIGGSGAVGTAKVATAGGLRTLTFDTSFARVVVNLPDDMRAGDTISGTVRAEPKGETKEDRERNGKMVSDATFTVTDKGNTNQAYSVKLVGDSPSPGPPLQLIVTKITFKAPAAFQCALQEGSQNIVQATIEIPPNIVGGELLEPPNRTTIPPFLWFPMGQQGRPIEIYGPFDGNSSNTSLNWSAARSAVQDFEKNTENVSGGFGLIAESPRKAVFQAPTNVTGPIELNLKEGNVETKGTYRNVGVNLTAPKTSLLKGESTELHVEVNGLQGIKQPVPLTLESHGVITMVGGNYQPLLIQPSQVGPDGRFTTTRGITGIQTGGWTATATVVTHKFDICLQDDTAPARRILWNTFNGDYIFVCPTCWPPKGQQGGAGGTTGESGGTKTGGTKTGGTTETGGTTPPADPNNPPGGLTGQGKMIMKGCIITLEHNAPDRRVFSRLDSCTTSGISTIEDPKTKVKFTITDRNIADNTCQSQ